MPVIVSKSHWLAAACMAASFALGVLATRLAAPRETQRFVPDLSGLAAFSHDTDYVAQSKRLIDEKRYAEAVAVGERGLSLHADSVPLRLNLAVAQLLVGDIAAGRKNLADVVARDSDNGLARNNLRWADALRAEREARIAELDRSFALAAAAPARVAVLRDRAQAYTQLGDTSHAIADYDALLALAPDDVAALNNAGVVLMQAQRYDDAEARFIAAARRAPREALYRNNLQWALRKRAGQ